MVSSSSLFTVYESHALALSSSICTWHRCIVCAQWQWWWWNVITPWPGGEWEKKKQNGKFVIYLCALSLACWELSQPNQSSLQVFVRMQFALCVLPTCCICIQIAQFEAHMISQLIIRTFQLYSHCRWPFSWKTNCKLISRRTRQVCRYQSRQGRFNGCNYDVRCEQIKILNDFLMHFSSLSQLTLGCHRQSNLFHFSLSLALARYKYFNPIETPELRLRYLHS